MERAESNRDLTYSPSSLDYITGGRGFRACLLRSMFNDPYVLIVFMDFSTVAAVMDRLSFESLPPRMDDMVESSG